MKLPANMMLYCTPNETLTQAAVNRALFYNCSEEVEDTITPMRDRGVSEVDAVEMTVMVYDLADPMLTESEAPCPSVQ